MVEMCVENFLFSNLNFKTKKKCVCISGANGSGKTTLIKCILGLEKYKGIITIDNKNIDLDNTSFLFSEDNLGFDELTVKENLEYYLKILEIDFDKKLYLKLMNQFNINKYEDYLFKNISQGTKQKVRLIFVLLQKKKIVILDEPTNYLDNNSIDNLADYINRNDEYIFIISTNDEMFLKKINSDLLNLEDNQICLRY